MLCRLPGAGDGSIGARRERGVVGGLRVCALRRCLAVLQEMHREGAAQHDPLDVFVDVHHHALMKAAKRASRGVSLKARYIQENRAS